MLRNSALVTLSLLFSICESKITTRINSTGAIDTFLITDCAECTICCLAEYTLEQDKAVQFHQASLSKDKDRNSIFCTTAESQGNFVANASYKVTIKDKIDTFGASDGQKFCWAGTWGTMLTHNGEYQNLLGTVGKVQASLSCREENLYYRQCVLSSQLSTILISIGSIVFLCCCTCSCFYCGCCKCYNNPGDLSNWGMCNRFCPTAPCADPPEKVEVLSDSILNPKSEEEQLSSLFGKNKKLNSQMPSFKEASSTDDSFSVVNPTLSKPLGPPPSLPPPGPPPSLPPPAMLPPPPAAAPVAQPEKVTVAVKKDDEDEDDEDKKKPAKKAEVKKAAKKDEDDDEDEDEDEKKPVKKDEAKKKTAKKDDEDDDEDEKKPVEKVEAKKSKKDDDDDDE